MTGRPRPTRRPAGWWGARRDAVRGGRRDPRYDEAQLRRAIERDLAETTERYRSLFDYHPHAVYELDLEGNFVRINQASQHITGYSVEELATMHFADVVVDEDLERVGEAFLAVVNRESRHLEIRVRRRDGAVVDVEVTGLPVVVGDEVLGVYGIAEDITERNRLQRDLEQARQAAEEASAAKSLFLANVSHEIRTPLTSVLASAELLADTVTDPAEARLVDRVQRSGARLQRLVEQILDFSRIEAGEAAVHPEPVDLRQLVEEVVRPVRASAEAGGLDFVWTLEPETPQVVADADRVAQVLENLLDNAVKFTPTGEVRLDVRAGDHLDIRVTDTGIGMSPAEAETVFEAFRQADPSITRRYGGTGLGLAICQQLVELMDGSITVESEAGVGTTFEVRLPLRRSSPVGR